MRFAIFRDIEIKGKKTRKFLLEWDQEKILSMLRKEIEGEFNYKGLNQPCDVADVIERKFLKVIDDFKKQTIKIP